MSKVTYCVHNLQAQRHLGKVRSRSYSGVVISHEALSSFPLPFLSWSSPWGHKVGANSSCYSMSRGKWECPISSFSQRSRWLMIKQTCVTWCFHLSVRHANVWHCRTWVRHYVRKGTSANTEKEGSLERSRAVIQQRRNRNYAHQATTTHFHGKCLAWSTPQTNNTVRTHSTASVLSRLPSKHVAPLSSYYNLLWFLQSKARFIFYPHPLWHVRSRQRVNESW